jgi:hypothetical protein
VRGVVGRKGLGGALMASGGYAAVLCGTRLQLLIPLSVMSAATILSSRGMRRSGKSARVGMRRAFSVCAPFCRRRSRKELMGKWIVTGDSLEYFTMEVPKGASIETVILI